MKRGQRAMLAAYRRHSGLSDAFIYEAAASLAELSGSGLLVLDEQGEAYLDFAGGFGVFAVGHGSPAVRSSVLAQLGTLPALAPASIGTGLEQRLRAIIDRILPVGLETLSFVGSGSRAMDMAINLCLSRGRAGVVAAHEGFHGSTLGTLGIAGHEHWRNIGGRPIATGVSFVPYGDLDAAARAIDRQPACFVLEPVQGETLSAPPTGYLRQVQALCAGSGTWLVVDEVSTSFGRTGQMWGVDHEGVRPEILVFSKAGTGGHAPFAGLAARKQVIDVARAADSATDAGLLQPYESISLLSLAAAAAAIEVIVRDDLVSRARSMGEELQRRLASLAADFPQLVLEARGQGLLRGVRTQNIAVHHLLWLALMQRRILCAPTTDLRGRTPMLRFIPPFTVDIHDLDLAAEKLQDSLQRLSRPPRVVFDLVGDSIRIRERLPVAVQSVGMRLLQRLSS